MKRLLLVPAFLGALVLPVAASAWDGVQVTVTFPERVTAGRSSVLLFHVFVGGRALDLATVGPRSPGLNPTVVFTKGRREVRAAAQRTTRPGLYRVRVVLPSIGGWSYRFEYAGLVRSYPQVVARR